VIRVLIVDDSASVRMTLSEIIGSDPDLEVMATAADPYVAVERIRQEVAVYGVKVDITEELQRLQAHLEETRRVLDAGGAVGKRLDFLMQEFNREANTICSKAIVTATTFGAVELKVLIEQMREQIQNIE
jgi:uncharacterized protein (TIGR00255 family)